MSLLDLECINLINSGLNIGQGPVNERTDTYNLVLAALI